jgi:hypothetical protein
MSINGASIDLSQAGDEEAFQLWLRDPASAVAHLVEIDYNGTSAVYPNWSVFTVKSSDRSDLSFTGYPDRVKSIGSFSRQIGTRFTGVVTATLGDIEFYNTDGSLDSWHNLSFDGQRVRVLYGDPAWPRERFRILFECVAEVATAVAWDTFKLRLRGIDYKSNLPLQTNLISTVATNSSANLPIPKAFGSVTNVEPAVLDVVNLIYQWNDGAVTSVSDVRDGGIPFKTAHSVISAVTGNLITTSTTHGFYANTRIRSDIGTLPTADLWYASAWNGQIFCAIRSAANKVAISSDGIKWTEVGNLTGFITWHGITWNGRVFCMVGGSGTYATSPDGITWTQGQLPGFGFFTQWESVCWNGAIFCAVGTNSNTTTKACMTSPDGQTWTLQTMPSSATWMSVAWTGLVFCAVAGGVATTAAATSADGVTWVARTMPSSSYWTSIVWNGLVLCAISSGLSGATAAATSADGVSWAAQNLSSSHRWRSLAWNGLVLCAVALDASVASTSPDGVTWTDRTLPGATNWSSISWGASIFCAIAYNATYSSVSTDGTSWTPVSGTLPSPLVHSTDYWVIPDGLTATAFKVSASRGGPVLTLTNTTTGGAIIGYHWTADLTTGKVSLSSKSAGKVTLDGLAGSTDASTIAVSALSATNIDPSSQAKFKAVCTQTMGIYVKDRRNRIDVANDVLNGIGAWYGYSREGMLRFGRVEGNPASYDFVLAEDDMTLNSLLIESIVKPEKQHRLSFKNNWTNQNGALFAGVSADQRALYSNDSSVSLASTSADVGPNGSFHALAVIPDAQPTMLAFSSDAAAESTRLDAMYYGWGAVFSCEVGRIGTQFDIGRVVKVTHSRYNLSGGVNMTCVYAEDNPTADKVKLKFFVALAAYTPGQL